MKTNTKQIIITISLLIIFNFIACDQKKEDENDVIFNVDSTLLASKYKISNLQLIFRPPIICNPLPEELVNKISSELDSVFRSSENFVIQPIHIFADSLNEINCSVSQISHISKDSIDTFINSHYFQFLKKSFRGAAIKKGNHKIGELNITQYLISTSKKVVFKLTFLSPNNVATQIDYTIVRSKYPNYSRHIESSMGSISALN